MSEKREKTSKNDSNSTLFGRFWAISGTLPAPRLPLLAWARCKRGMEGMHTVWRRYGKGMRPSLKSFTIKYGGMAYRGGGGVVTET